MQALDGIEKRVETCVAGASRGVDALPVRKEAGQRVLFDRLDFTAKFGERFAANLAQDLRVAPLTMESAGTESAFENAALGGKLAQCVLDRGDVQGKPVRGLAQSEGRIGE